MAFPKPNALRVESLEDRCLLSGDVILHWNELLVQSLGASPLLQPLVTRNMALVHVAMFDAVNAIDRSYEPYHADVHAPPGASPEAAAAQAAHDTLVALYPSRQEAFDTALAEDLAGIAPAQARQGAAVGQKVARRILDLRSDDGSGANVPYTPPNSDPGQWQPTDASPAAGAHIPAITPFAVDSSDQFRPGPPPDLASPEYAAALNEVKALGSLDSTVRTADQTQVGLIWRAPLPHFQIWNRIARGAAETRGLSIAENARLFALLNMSLNDGLQTSFESKYFYALWRPVTAIHRADEDGNSATEADPGWTPLHPATPPYPTYAGNAATIGATAATVLAGVFEGDAFPFTIDWGVYGFAGVERSYDGFWDAADEAARSRVYGGIHFTFDSVAGQAIGADVARHVMDHFLLPRGGGGDRLAAASPVPGPASGTAWPEDDAAGWGWSVDLTPGLGSEFTAPDDQGRTIVTTVLEDEAGYSRDRGHEADSGPRDAWTLGTRRVASTFAAADLLLDPSGPVATGDDVSSLNSIRQDHPDKRL